MPRPPQPPREVSQHQEPHPTIVSTAGCAGRGYAFQGRLAMGQSGGRAPAVASQPGLAQALAQALARALARALAQALVEDRVRSPSFSISLYHGDSRNIVIFHLIIFLTSSGVITNVAKKASRGSISANCSSARSSANALPIATCRRRLSEPARTATTSSNSAPRPDLLPLPID